MKKQQLTFNSLDQYTFIKKLKGCKTLMDLSELKQIAQMDSVGHPKTQAVIKHVFEEAAKTIATDPSWIKCIDFPALIHQKIKTTFIPENYTAEKPDGSSVSIASVLQQNQMLKDKLDDVKNVVFGTMIHYQVDNDFAPTAIGPDDQDKHKIEVLSGILTE